jgi:hypothetical protein
MGTEPIRDEEDRGVVTAVGRVVSVECAAPSSATGWSRSAILGFGALSDAATDELRFADMVIVM